MKKKIDSIEFAVLGKSQTRVTVSRGGYEETREYYPGKARMRALQNLLREKVETHEMFTDRPYFASWGYATFNYYTKDMN